ncbi:LPXTG cell wall anchor domain-containing protein [Kitasatospora sp. MAP5-34]|uniref:DUF7927 domain-containing protein n=1 Tax=Kitasatospora sp. MAP5-34 TaxID=3035102 RepID=UPI0024749F61|nr:LPXTG cell wall anchor domain-containing protein [Kitasatospora sp. MAP5-34]
MRRWVLPLVVLCASSSGLMTAALPVGAQARMSTQASPPVATAPEAADTSASMATSTVPAPAQPAAVAPAVAPAPGSAPAQAAAPAPAQDRGDDGDWNDKKYCHLKILKTADRDFYLPGQKVTYTIKLTNDGDVPITGAVVTDDLSGDLADAVYDNDATVGVGQLSYNAPILTWTGDLNPGDSTSVVYSLTADNPDNGPMRLRDAVTGPPFSNCPMGTEPGCHVELGSPHWTVAKSEDKTDVEPGDVIHYTITATNDGTVDFVGARQAGLEDDMSKIVGESVYDADATADIGTVTFQAPSFVIWRGDLPAGATVTIHLSITSQALKSGDTELVNIVRALYPHHGGTDLSNPLPPQTRSGGVPADFQRSLPALRLPSRRDDTHVPQIPACTVDPATDSCFVDADEPTFVVAKSVDHTVAHPGDVVTYRVEFGNTGNDQFPAGELPVVTDDLTQVLDDASFVTGSLASSVPAASFDPATSKITWTGQLTSGQQGYFTYQVRVNNPYHGDFSLDNVVVSEKSTDCKTGSTDTRCRTHVPVVVPGPGGSPSPSPSPSPSSSSTPPAPPKHHQKPHGPHGNELAHTGASATPTVVAVALTLLVAGSGLFLLTRRRSRKH